MLKWAVTGGPSLVFTKYHEAGVWKIRGHQMENAKVCKKIEGYDANAFYLSTMLQDMPCRPGIVRHNATPAVVQRFLVALQSGKWLGLAEVDMTIPEELKPKFEEMGSPFVNKEIPEEAMPEEMKEYLKRTGRGPSTGKKFVETLPAKKILVYAPLLKWYLRHRAVVKAM